MYRPHGYKVILEATCQAVPRAALFITNSLQSVSLGHLNTPDCAAAQMKWNSIEILIASVYLDEDDDLPSPWLVELVEYGDDRNMAILIGMDSNAHSLFYSQAVTDERGSNLEDFILTYGLDLANIGHVPTGHVPTFQTFRAQSVIDITLMKGIGIHDWHVDTEYNTSDHNTISFFIEVDSVPSHDVREMGKS